MLTLRHGRHKRQISYETTQRLKQKLKQDNESVLEHSASVNDCIGRSVLDNDIEYVTKYNEILDSITPDEVSDAIQKYFDMSKCAITIVHPAKIQKLMYLLKVNPKTDILLI